MCCLLSKEKRVRVCGGRVVKILYIIYNFSRIWLEKISTFLKVYSVTKCIISFHKWSAALENKIQSLREAWMFCIHLLYYIAFADMWFHFSKAWFLYLLSASLVWFWNGTLRVLLEFIMFHIFKYLGFIRLAGKLMRVEYRFDYFILLVNCSFNPSKCLFPI